MYLLNLERCNFWKRYFSFKNYVWFNWNEHSYNVHICCVNVWLNHCSTYARVHTCMGNPFCHSVIIIEFTCNMNNADHGSYGWNLLIHRWNYDSVICGLIHTHTCPLYRKQGCRHQLVNGQAGHYPAVVATITAAGLCKQVLRISDIPVAGIRTLLHVRATHTTRFIFISTLVWLIFLFVTGVDIYKKQHYSVQLFFQTKYKLIVHSDRFSHRKMSKSNPIEHLSTFYSILLANQILWQPYRSQ